MRLAPLVKVAVDNHLTDEAPPIFPARVGPSKRSVIEATEVIVGEPGVRCSVRRLVPGLDHPHTRKPAANAGFSVGDTGLEPAATPRLSGCQVLSDSLRQP